MAWPALSARSKNWGTEILTDSDLESELDLLHDYVNDMMNSSTGHKHDGTTAEGPKIDTGGLAADAADSTIVDLTDNYTWTGTHDFTGATVTGAGLNAASQAQMETATDNTVAATPGRVQNHPGVAKFWVKFNGTSSDPITAAGSYNLNGTITKNATGDYTLTIDTDFSSANYAFFGTAVNENSSIQGVVAVQTTPTAGTLRIQTRRTDTVALTDFTHVSVIAFGDQ